MAKSKKPFWIEEQPREQEDTRTEVDIAIDNSIAMLMEIKQIQRFKAAVESIGQPMENILGPKRSAVYGQVVGVWLRKRDYATKQKGHPSDYRAFPKPITLSERSERRIFQ